MNRVALVVGINSYKYFQPLKAPATDAEAIAQRLEQAGEFRVIRMPEAIAQENEQRSPTVGTTLHVTQAKLEKALKQLFCPDSPQIPETALFYFSGHGLRDPDGAEGLDKGYLVTSETPPQQPRPGIPLAWLQNLLNRSPIKNQIVWLDCCHSGGLLIDVAAANPGHGNNRNRCFIASSRDFEKSWPDLNSPYSVLTKALLEGMDPIRLPGQWINTYDLVPYVHRILQGKLQLPVCNNWGSEPIELTHSWRDSNTVNTTLRAEAGKCPYKGLEFFDFNEQDPQYFFGREILTRQLLDQARTANFIALVGASGSGKSSLLRAGLLHHLRQGKHIAGSEHWHIYIARPDAQPRKSLAAAFVPETGSQVDRAVFLERVTNLLEKGASGLVSIVKVATAPRIVLVIDQFEEVFTRCSDANEQDAFIDCLMGALAETGDKLCLIITMRVDFVSKCLEHGYSELAKRIHQDMVSVFPLQPIDMRVAICQPAQQVGLTVEETLVTEILTDLKGSPGSLPLLQYTLKELWQRRQNNQLTLATYLQLGRLSGTLDKRATELYQSFSISEQRTVQYIFQLLTQLGEGTENTCRRMFLNNLVAEPQHSAIQVNRVIEVLAAKDNRLLVTNEIATKDVVGQRRTVVDVAHEALIRHWHLLRQWIEQNRYLLRQQRYIEANAVKWQECDQSRGYLLRDLPLKEAVQFQKQQANILPLSNAIKAYIQKSVYQRNLNRLKIVSWFAIFLLPVIDFSVHNWEIEQHYSNLGGSNKQQESESTDFLTKGCSDSEIGGKKTNYFQERFRHKYCQSLSNVSFGDNAQFEDATLSFVNFKNANLREANFSRAKLKEANLTDAQG